MTLCPVLFLEEQLSRAEPSLVDRLGFQQLDGACVPTSWAIVPAAFLYLARSCSWRNYLKYYVFGYSRYGQKLDGQRGALQLSDLLSGTVLICRPVVSFSLTTDIFRWIWFQMCKSLLGKVPVCISSVRAPTDKYLLFSSSEEKTHIICSTGCKNQGEDLRLRIQVQITFQSMF